MLLIPKDTQRASVLIHDVTTDAFRKDRLDGGITRHIWWRSRCIDGIQGFEAWS